MTNSLLEQGVVTGAALAGNAAATHKTAEDMHIITREKMDLFTARFLPIDSC